AAPGALVVEPDLRGGFPAVLGLAVVVGQHEPDVGVLLEPVDLVARAEAQVAGHRAREDHRADRVAIGIDRAVRSALRGRARHAHAAERRRAGLAEDGALRVAADPEAAGADAPGRVQLDDDLVAEGARGPEIGRPVGVVAVALLPGL